MHFMCNVAWVTVEVQKLLCARGSRQGIEAWFPLRGSRGGQDLCSERRCIGLYPVPADFPLQATLRAQLVDLYTSDRNLLPGVNREEKEALLDKISYRDWLTRYWRLDERAATFPRITAPCS